MQSTDDFLIALGLDETADIRAIRRAYAHRLKQIDQAANAAGFQILREAYEMARHWAANREERSEQAQAWQTASEALLQGEQEQLASAKVRQVVSSEAERALEAVWERYQSDVRELATAQRLADADAWQDILRTRLTDEELINIDAHTQFEWRIVHTLGGGWRPGHEALLPAAAEAFGWTQERRSLAQFGDCGHLLSQAIDERAWFLSRAIVVRSVQERILMLLRREGQADTREILQSMPELASMQACFPALLWVVTNPANVEHWHTTCNAHAANRRTGPANQAAHRRTMYAENIEHWRTMYVEQWGAEHAGPGPVVDETPSRPRFIEHWVLWYLFACLLCAAAFLLYTDRNEADTPVQESSAVLASS